MKKSLICMIVSLALLLSCLCGCDLSFLGQDILPSIDIPFVGSSNEPSQVPTFESYHAMITRDDLVLWKEPDPTSEILGQVSSGDTLHVLRLVTIDGVEWASTDRGWIYAVQVQTPTDISQTPPSSETIEATVPPTTESVYQPPIYDGSNASVITSTSEIHVSSNPASNIRGTLTSGTRVTISQITHYGNTAMVYIGNGWIKLQDIHYDTCSRSGALPCIVTYDGMNVRYGPSTNYKVVYQVSAGTEILLSSIMNSDMQGKPWVESPEGYWYFLEYLRLPQGINHAPGDNADRPFPSANRVKP